MEPTAAVEDVAEAVASHQPAPEVDTLAEAGHKSACLAFRVLLWGWVFHEARGKQVLLLKKPARHPYCFAETVASPELYAECAHKTF